MILAVGAVAAVTVTAALLMPLFGVGKLRVVHVALFGAPLFFVGAKQYDATGEILAIVAVHALAVFAGFYTVRATQSAQRQPRHGISIRRSPVVILIAITGTVLHFGVTGIPLFSGDVEISRLERGSSGMAGFPSRMYLYGLTIGLLWSVGEARLLRDDWFRDKWVIAAMAAYSVSRVLGGFKSGLLQVEITIVLILILLWGGIRLPRYAGRLFLAGGASLAFVFLIATTYSSYQSTSVVDSLAARLTSVSVEPVAMVLQSENAYLGEDRTPLVLDSQYFAARYFGVGEQSYGFTKLIAARWVGESPLADRIFPPVTLNGGAVLSRQFGLAVSIILMLVVGRLMAMLEVGGQRTCSPMVFMLSGVALVAMIEFISRGEIVYSIINWSASVFFLVALSRVLHIKVS